MTFRDRFLPSDPRHVGREPDYRFTLANERTFLAWVRTALALAAGGLGVINLLPDLVGSELLGVLLLTLSFLTAATAYRRWANNEKAMRLGEALPTSSLPQYMAAGTALVALVAAALFVIDQL
jgi:putative membrane protein